METATSESSNRKPRTVKLSLGLFVLLAVAVTLNGAKADEAAPTPAPINYARAPVAPFDYGLVRVWNAKGEPPAEAGRVPEARLGDGLVAEVKHIDDWLCANLDAGAWAQDTDAPRIDPAVRKVIEARNLGPVVRAAKWLAIKKSEDSPAAVEDAAATDEKNVKLLATLKTSPDLKGNGFPAKDENDNPLNPANPKDATHIVDVCQKALAFMTNFRRKKAAEFILTINETRLPKLSVTAADPRAGWRSASDRKEEGDYTWWRIRLRASEDPDLDKAWTDLMRAIEPHFSLQSKLSLSLPGELVPMPTNVTPTAEDSRCRFVMIAITRMPRLKKKMAVGDAVYPLDLRERINEVRKGEIVEVDNQNAAAPYVVHFIEAGGTRHYDSKDLARLPPDPVPQGVVRVWNMDESGSEWETAQKDEIPAAKIGDHLVVEVRNFDGWLCNEVDQGFFRDDPLIQKASPPLAELIRTKNFSHAVKVGVAISLVGYKSQYTSADIVRRLEKEALSNPDLAGLVVPTLGPPKLSKLGELKDAPILPTPTPTATPTPKTTGPAATSATATTTPTPIEVKKETAQQDDEATAKQFLAPYKEAHSLLRELVKSKLRALNLTVNDLLLGVTPDNSDFTPIPQSRRPADDPDDDTYHWLKFAFAPKPIASLTEDEKAAADPFKRLLDKPSFFMPSKVTLSLKSGAETITLPTAVTPQAKDKRCRFNLIGISRWMFWSIAVVFFFIAISLGFFAARTDILRDPCRRRPEGVEPVSLARTQMAFWFVVIAAAFLFLWVTTGNIATINSTCLVLLAIGTTTAIASASIKGGKDRRKDLGDALQKTPHDMLRMTPEGIQDEITARIAKLENAGPDQIKPEEKAEQLQILQRHQKEIACFINNKPSWLPKTVYFWRYRLRSVFEDLLTEEAGTYDFQRFQILAWTLVLGTVFVVKVFYDRVMPTFDSNVLLLMGISSGAYLGFKKFSTDRAEEQKQEEKKKSATTPGGDVSTPTEEQKAAAAAAAGTTPNQN